MNDIAKGVLVGVFSAVIIAGLGYFFLAKENQLRIESIEKLLLKYDGQMEKSGETINALKLFVVSAHPDKNYMPIVSAKKLEAMDTDSIELMAASMTKVDDKESWVEEFQTSTALRPIVDGYELTTEDLENFYNAAEIHGKSR